MGWVLLYIEVMTMPSLYGLVLVYEQPPRKQPRGKPAASSSTSLALDPLKPQPFENIGNSCYINAALQVCPLL